jgi:hypothetical protein
MIVTVDRTEDEHDLFHDEEGFVARINHIAYLKLRIKIRQKKETGKSGYYFMFKDERIDILSNGHLSPHHPKGLFTELQDLMFCLF